jgi:hypothetical protein
MGKEEKDKKLKRYIDKEYPKWASIDYKLQDAQFFKDVRQLPTKGLDPKHDLTNEHVAIIDIANMFGHVETLKTTNPLLPTNAKKEIETLY